MTDIRTNYCVACKEMADRIEAMEREILRRGDEERLLGLRDEYGSRIYDRADLATIKEAAAA